MEAQMQPKVLIERQELENTVRRLAAQINKDYREKKPVLIAVLKGAFIFLADLVRHLDLKLEVEFVCLSSYGQSRESKGEVKLVQGLCSNIRNRDVIIIEDIIDTGITTDFLLNYLNQQEPSSIRICVLISKPSRRKVPIIINYLGFEVADRFIVGYGLDWDENFRHLPELYSIEDE
ncbi:MAG: hypoxanthine phosphoribosyltransferase [Dehalococcoidia bacterium]|nr:MAG: hypoxanthine phosphoribosyltransferase [Dehalococcoidia bacterium]